MPRLGPSSMLTLPGVSGWLHGRPRNAAEGVPATQWQGRRREADLRPAAHSGQRIDIRDHLDLVEG